MEFVYVVRRRDLFEVDAPQGFKPMVTPSAAAQGGPAAFLAIARNAGFFVERRAAEQDPSWKQLIPYCIVYDAESLGREPLVLRLRRTAKQGESRLHEKLSIGIGGHLNPLDAGVESYEADEPARESRQLVLDRGVERELGEELNVQWLDGVAAKPVPLGVLNDDSTPVGSVHFGVVFGVPVSPATTIRETDRMTGEWVPWSTLRQEAAAGANFESWSAILLRSLSTDQLNTALGRRILAPASRRAEHPQESPASSS